MRNIVLGLLLSIATIAPATAADWCSVAPNRTMIVVSQGNQIDQPAKLVSPSGRETTCTLLVLGDGDVGLACHGVTITGTDSDSGMILGGVLYRNAPCPRLK